VRERDNPDTENGKHRENLKGAARGRTPHIEADRREGRGRKKEALTTNRMGGGQPHPRPKKGEKSWVNTHQGGRRTPLLKVSRGRETQHRNLLRR